LLKLPLLTWIGNAAAALCGRHGDVTAQARQAGCSRQTVYDHADKVQHALAQAHLSGPSREQLLRECAQLREENRQLWDWLDQSGVPPVLRGCHGTEKASSRWQRYFPDERRPIAGSHQFAHDHPPATLRLRPGC
jgi:hypothetical protein